ncbi:dTDP-4-dehydrorhamnose reductase [Priestia megaterium]|uniref:dTDP-4-dehydrorhamnose reductase n=1 Tax=Priestia megaterium TaxID=1404 RepID=UPI0013E3CB53|nr:dTDP-4-dehydrorhamnose reductase [Priestia megaterium]MED3865133.1 dTDP-4-dehydrorhamnose reductase [Priestia megaterium]MED4100482.1 dTDP-4-dehydrorhamnose reductase [Priestia megaterium]MED4144467.1 dTDP-4-dehydrorhamnose reductase [Priestia megaterium]MED4165766.1 dTDP-4-dehydrorhamnose reductase [Priestia megaterium]MED4200506.1 dTDP-4-dehydrorhamnose reductase [Priestia megaterium]
MGQKVLITGANGQLGKELVELFSEKDFDVYGFGRDKMDITNQEQVQEIMSTINPDIVIHSAAHTKVDLAESEPEQAFLINGYGTRNVAVAAERVGAKLVYVSTDYVFDGTGNTPYNEFAPTSPLGVYGKSKLAGEQFVRDLHSKFFIVRTSWVYGKHGANFVKTMLKLGEERKELSVVSDQIGCPTYTLDLANSILEIVASEKYGIYHVSNSGSCSWYEFAKAIFEEVGLDIQVNPCTTEEFPRPAARPAYSVFKHMSLQLNGFQQPREWKEGLLHFLSQQY